MSIDAFHLIEKHLPDVALRPLHLQMLRASLQAATTLAPYRGAKPTPFMASISPMDKSHGDHIARG